MTCASAAARKMEKKEQGQWTERVSRENLTEWVFREAYLGAGLGPGLSWARVGPGPNNTHSEKKVKLNIRCFNIRANFMKGSTGAFLLNKG